MKYVWTLNILKCMHKELIKSEMQRFYLDFVQLLNILPHKSRRIVKMYDYSNFSANFFKSLCG